MTLSTELHKFPHEVEQLSIDEYERLVAFFIWRNRKDEAARKKAIKKSKGK